MYVVVVTEPEPLVSLELAKKHVRCDHDEDDDLLEAYIAGVSAAIDGPGAYLSRCVGRQLLELRSDRLCESMLMPYGPVSEIERFEYTSPEGAEVTVEADDYALVDPYISPPYGSSWPAVRLSRGSVRIRYWAGYESIPKPIVTAALLLVGELYANKEDSSATIAIDGPAAALLQPYLCWWP